MTTERRRCHEKPIDVFEPCFGGEIKHEITDNFSHKRNEIEIVDSSPEPYRLECATHPVSDRSYS